MGFGPLECGLRGTVRGAVWLLHGIAAVAVAASALPLALRLALVAAIAVSAGCAGRPGGRLSRDERGWWWGPAGAASKAEAFGPLQAVPGGYRGRRLVIVRLLGEGRRVRTCVVHRQGQCPGRWRRLCAALG